MIDVARAVFSQTEYRKTNDIVRQAVLTRDALATELTFKSLFANAADAEAFANKIMDLRSPGRGDWKLSVPTEVANQLVVGMTITVKHRRFGLENGKDFIVKGVRKELGNLLQAITLYGPR